ncbi:hypothetical protein KR100_11840 [Synechococcus sp. KORDI-100]|nr:hypothetical protein KR100_11840 [Synechococcus sp. KORDI-100]
MNRLRGQSQMAHDGDPHAHQAIDHRHHFRFRSLQLHSGGTRFLQQSSGGPHREIFAALIAEKGKITDQQRLR